MESGQVKMLQISPIDFQVGGLFSVLSMCAAALAFFFFFSERDVYCFGFFPPVTSFLSNQISEVQKGLF